MEPMWQFWPRVARAWAALKAAAGEGGGQRVVAVTHSPVLTAILCQCLGMDPADTAKLRWVEGGCGDAKLRLSLGQHMCPSPLDTLARAELCLLAKGPPFP